MREREREREEKVAYIEVRCLNDIDERVEAMEHLRYVPAMVL